MGEEFYIQTLIQFVVAFLSATVKNPTSGRAQRLRYYVQKAYDAFGFFLAQTNPARLNEPMPLMSVSTNSGIASGAPAGGS